MSIMEVLTLLLVLFAALSYIDNQRNKHPYPSKSEDAYSYKSILLLRAIGDSIPITSK